MTSPDVHSLVGAYALDAVDDLERAAFERHLAGCETCRAEVAELRETSARLADSTWSVPPPRLRAEVMAEIGRTRQAPPPAEPDASPDRRSTPAWQRYSIAAAAAVVLAAGTGASVYAIQEQKLRDSSAVVAAAQLREARTQAILSAGDLVVRTAPMIGGGRVTVASSATLRASVVTIRSDRTLAANQALQMWTIRGTGSPVSPAVMAPGEESGVAVLDGVPGNDVFAVSLEPAGGSPTPSSTIMAKVQLT
ncbi:anti-sigma factor domain-containing protein [Actinoplanes sp. NPDC049681]|uniref:anti-sigma factor n=1 Tax=Actinoplanes sp. NPDC049681 TaxID=3363905 RepID=UPI0037927564